MRSQADHDSPDIPAVIGRRSARLSVIVPLTIRGISSNGKAFKENTWTSSINKQGARLFAFHEPSRGEELTLENPVLGRTAKGKIVRVCEKRFPEDPYEICVELSDAQNVWGVKFPPEDWQRERPRTLPAQPSAKTGAVASATDEPSAPPAAGSDETEPSPAPTTAAAQGPGSPSGDFNQVHLAMSGLSRFARQSGEGAGNPPMPAEEKSAVESAPLSPGYYQEALRLLDDRIEKIRLLERDLSTLGGRLESSRAELEEVIVKAHEAEQRWPESSEKIRRDIQEAGEQALQSSLEKAKLMIGHDITSASATALESARKCFQEEIAKGTEELIKSAQARLATLSGEWFSKSSAELQARRDEATGKVKAELGGIIEAQAAGLRESFRKQEEEISAALLKQAEKQFEAAAQSATARFSDSLIGQAAIASHTQDATLHQILQQAHQNLEAQITRGEGRLKSLEEKAVETAKATVTQSSEEAMKALQAAATEAVARADMARQKLDEASRTAAENFRVRLAEVSTKALEGSRNYTEAQFQGLKTEVEEALRKVQDQCFKNSEERLKKLGEDAVQSAAAQLQKATGGELDRITAGLSAAEKKALEDFHKQLSAVGQSSIASLILDAKATGEEYRAQLHKVYQEFQERAEHDLLAQLRATSDRQREAAGEQLRTEVGAASERIATEIKTFTERMIKEAADTMYKQVGMAAVAMKGWTDDARAQAEGYYQKSFADLQKRVSEFSAASLSAYLSELRALAENLSSRMEEASRLFQGFQKVPAAWPDKNSQVRRPEASNRPSPRRETAAEEPSTPLPQSLKEAS